MMAAFYRDHTERMLAILGLMDNEAGDCAVIHRAVCAENKKLRCNNCRLMQVSTYE